MRFSAIVPCYNEEENVADFYNEILKQEEYLKSNSLEFELIYVDDGSKDNTAKEVKALIEKDKRVHLISFSRNFGKEAAIYAGLQNAKGDFVAIMDADLQDPPALLPRMFDAVLKEGYDCAATRRVNRKGEPPIRSWFA
ncbi:MAG: glycosyltransferase family 2 protein, partial [Lachnospiraceae bacterium]|nr:glycosyltransferase family 2 protein [Lachnospiraceae bacterium]